MKFKKRILKSGFKDTTNHFRCLFHVYGPKVRDVDLQCL